MATFKTVAVTLITVIILSLILHNNAKGQVFVSEYNDWNVLYEEFGWGQYYANTDLVYLNGDSIIDGKSYKILWHKYFYNGNLSIGGLLREDSNKVYYIFGAEEGLLYDFQAEVGDTLTVINCFRADDPFDIRITNIDSAEYFGEWRTRWFIEDLYGTEDIILEGIGSSHGPVHTLQKGCPPFTEWNLLCFYENGTLAFRKEGYTSCTVLITNVDEMTAESHVRIFPNPALDKFEIRCSEFEVDEVIIYDLQGRIVLRNQLCSNNNILINCSTLNPGLYICYIQSSNQLITNKLIIR